jgi:Fe(3+) dicitrate transport protein
VQGRNLTGKDYVADYQNGMRPGAPRTVVAGVSVVFR